MQTTLRDHGVAVKMLTSPCDAAADLPDRLRKDHAGHRPRTAVQETRDVEHRGLHRGVCELGHRDGRGGAGPAEVRLVALRIGEQRRPLYTFSFLLLLYFAVFSVVSARERRAFWSTMPSTSLIGALLADAGIGTILTRVGLPGLLPLPWSQTLVVFVYTVVSCLVVNDAVKVVMIRWRVPAAVA
jgi:hypothetical protein